MDNAWSSVGGGPSDLTFPEQFLGTWKVQNTLIKVETPLGPEYVPDMKVQQSAICSYSQCVCTFLKWGMCCLARGLHCLPLSAKGPQISLL